MGRLSLYLDECFDRRVIRPLRQRGFDVLTVQEAGTRRDDDEAQLEFATSQGRILLSHNQVHFRRLHTAFHRAGREHGGIILIPQTVPFARLDTRVRFMMDWIAPVPDVRSRLFRWGELQQQLIHGYRMPTWSEEDVRDALGRQQP